MKKSRKLKTIGILCAGAGVGAAAALLTAPQSGKRTRNDLRNYANEMKDSIGTCIADTKKTMDHSRATVVSPLDGVRENLDGVRKNIDERVEQLGHYIRVAEC